MCGNKTDRDRQTEQYNIINYNSIKVLKNDNIETRSDQRCKTFAENDAISRRIQSI